MHTPQAGRPAGVIAVTLLLAGAAGATCAATPAAAGQARSGPAGPAAPVSVNGFLTAVAGTSAASAWAAGSKANARGIPETLIMRWNGATWTRVPSPATPGGSELAGVAALSARGAWAVGDAGIFASRRSTLILRWNGTSWTRVPSPTPAGGGVLHAVAAVSASSAWAAGSYDVHLSNMVSKTLILRWNGTAWTRVPSPTPANGDLSLDGVAAVSARSAWAVGTYLDARFNFKTLILRWNGTTWKQVPSPTPAGGRLLAVAATSASNAWAVGTTAGKTLILRWNGTTWKQVSSPSPATSAFLSGVAALSARSAWAVGSYPKGPTLVTQTLILRWNGTRWKRVPSPTPAGGAFLLGVAAVSARSAWAVGGGLILSWNGTSWR
jgi:hypothetical protein